MSDRRDALSGAISGPGAQEISTRIRKAMARELGKDPSEIDTSRSFLSFGLDSVVAFTLTGELAEWLDRELPATLAWDHPSIDALIEFLTGEDTHAPSPVHPLLVPMSSGDEAPAVFFMPGVGGHPVSFLPVAERLPAGQPAYGVLVPGLEDEAGPTGDIAAMAGEVIEAIRSVQARGPYRLAGYSFGGHLAFEVAQQLSKAGDSVPLLAIFDTFAPGGLVPRSRWLRPFIHALLLLRPVGRFAYLRGRAAQILRDRQPLDGEGLAVDLSASARAIELASLVCRGAAHAYRPQPYPGSVTLFRADGRDWNGHFYKKDPQNGWGCVARGGVEVISLPGTHNRLFEPENIELIARALSAHLAGSESGR